MTAFRAVGNSQSSPRYPSRFRGGIFGKTLHLRSVALPGGGPTEDTDWLRAGTSGAGPFCCCPAEADAPAPIVSLARAESRDPQSERLHFFC